MTYFFNKFVVVVFMGGSIVQGGLWGELFLDVEVASGGVGGNTTENFLDRIDRVFKLKIGKLFLMIGIYYLNRKLSLEVIKSNF